MVKLALGAGHWLGVYGKEIPDYMGSFEFKKEWELNARIVGYMEELLALYQDVEILRLDDVTGKRDVPLPKRTNKANSWGADLLISNHHNAGVGGGTGGGIVVIRYPNSTKFTKQMQTDLYNELIEHTGLKGNRYNPLSEANLHMLRESNMMAVLIENGFMDSKTDLPIILTDEFARQSAKAQVEFLVSLFDLKLKPVEIEEEILYRVQVGAFTVKSNADRLAHKLKGLDYDVIMVEDGKLYKVQTGAFANRDNADNVSEKLVKDGFDNFITTKQGNVVAIGKVEEPIKQETKEESEVATLLEAREYVGDRTIELQKGLKELRYYTGDIDNSFGTLTYNALIKFQSENGLTVDGWAGKNTFAKLNSLLADNDKYNPTNKEFQIALNKVTKSNLVIDGKIGSLTKHAMGKSSALIMRGKRNELVNWVQRKLADLGYYKDSIDSSFGANTEKAVVEFQSDNNLKSNGIVGIITYMELLIK